MKKEIIVYSISDSLGGTSQKLLSAVSAQYPDIIFNNSYRFPFINQEEELLDILCDAMKDDALVISTLVNSQLSAVAREFSQKQGLSYLDLMHPFLKSFKKKQGLDQSKSQEHCIVWIAIILRRFQRSSLLSNMMMVRHRRGF